MQGCVVGIQMSLVNAGGRSSSGAALRPSPVRQLLLDILSASDLDAPDARALFRYRVSDLQYKRGVEMLRRNLHFLDEDNAPMCALLVVVTAEWYRREASSLWRRWQDIGLVPDSTSVQERSGIVATGLRWWRLEVIVSKAGNVRRNEYLLTIALNGGLPSSMIVGENANRVRSYFESVMEDALELAGTSSGTRLIEIAAEHAEHLPPSYHEDIIYELTADLIGRLITYRAKLPEAVRDVNPVGWLDIAEPTWRDELPIWLPQDEAACNRLFNSLLALRPRAQTPGIGLSRLLERDSAGRWREGFEIFAEGRLDFPMLGGHGEGRFRALLTGNAARAMPREVAQLYQSKGDKGDRWVVTARSTLQRSFVGPVAFAESVKVTLLHDSKTLAPIEWPGGRPVPSVCHVLAEVPGRERLRVIGTGSVRSAAPSLFAWVPASAKVLGHDGGAARLTWQDKVKALWQIEGMAVVETSVGDRYRIQAGSKEPDSTDERRLDFDNVFLSGLTFEDSDLLVVQAPLVVRQTGLTHGSARGEIRFSRGQRSVERDRQMAGVHNVRWLDSEGFVVDQARVIAMPDDFNLRGLVERDGARLSWSSLPGWAVQAVDGEGRSLQFQSTSGGYLVRWTGVPSARLRLRIVDPHGTPVFAHLELDATQTMLADANGKIIAESSVLSPSQFRGASMMVGRPLTVDFELKGQGGTATRVARHVASHTPTVRFAELVEGLLGLPEARGPEVRVMDGEGRILCRIQRPQSQPTHVRGYITFSGQIGDDALAVARPLLQPEQEHALIPFGGGFRLPDWLAGPCLIYLRQGESILTRPAIIDAPLDPAKQIGLGAFHQIALLADPTDRLAAYEAALNGIGNDANEHQMIRQLIAIIFSLRGLSPRALDATRRLVLSPLLLCRLLLAAPEEKVESVLLLERHLPFLWMALPLSVWETAIKLHYEGIGTIFGELFPDANQAHSEGMKHFLKRLTLLVEQTIWFAGIRATVGSVPIGSSLMELARDHVISHGDQRETIPSQYADRANKIGLPPEIARLDFFTHTTLVAPLLFAAVAKGRLTMDEQLSAVLRNALDIDRAYVTGAFPHCLAYVKS